MCIRASVYQLSTTATRRQTRPPVRTLRGASIEQLDYEQTLGALQAFVGTLVMVSIADAESEWVCATIVGPLHSTMGTDLATRIAKVEGDFAGESVFFRVLNTLSTLKSLAASA